MRGNHAEISFHQDTLVFSNLKKGDSLLLTYTFKNVGKSNLRILDVGVDCGCTKPTFDTVFYKPNDEGKISVIFLSGNDTGHVFKNIVIKSNSASQLKVLYIKGNVIEP